MSETMRNNWSVQVAGMTLIAIVGTAGFWVAEGFAVAWPFALVMLAFIAVVHFGCRRSNVLESRPGPPATVSREPSRARKTSFPTSPESRSAAAPPSRVSWMKMPDAALGRR